MNLPEPHSYSGAGCKHNISHPCSLSSPKATFPGIQHRQGHSKNYSSLPCNLSSIPTSLEFKNFQELEGHYPLITLVRQVVRGKSKTALVGNCPQGSSVLQAPSFYCPLTPSLWPHFWNPYVEHVLPSAGAAREQGVRPGHAGIVDADIHATVLGPDS